MKRKLLILCAFCVSLAQAQFTALPYTEDFEGATIGNNPTTDLSPVFVEVVSDGDNSITIATGNGSNSSQVLKAVATSFSGNNSNHYINSPTFACTPETSYTVTFDLFATSTSTNFNILSSATGVDFHNGNDRLSPESVSGSVTVGSVALKVNKKGAVTANEIKDHANGWTTATFDFVIPAGHNAFRFQFYKFGIHTIEVDNITVIATDDLSVGAIETNAAELQSNLVTDSLTFVADSTISQAVAVNMLGAQTVLSSTDGKTFDTSALNSGIYIVKASLSNGASQAFQIIKK